MRVTVVALLLLAACGGSLPEAGKPILKLLDEGRGPRTALRYRVERGARQTMTMNIHMDMSGLPSPPNMLMTIVIDIMNVADNGDITYGFSIDDIQVVDSEGMPRGVPGPVQAAMDDLLGMSGSAVVTSRGETKSGALTVPPGASRQMREMMANFKQSLEQFSCPFPEEPVGVGAKWELHMRLDTPTFFLYQVGVFELVEFKDGKGVLKLTLTQEAQDQDMKVPGMPSAATMTLEELKSRGSGTIEFDLSKPAPTSATINITSDIKVKASLRGRVQRQSVTMRARMELESEDG